MAAPGAAGGDRFPRQNRVLHAKRDSSGRMSPLGRDGSPGLGWVCLQIWVPMGTMGSPVRGQSPVPCWAWKGHLWGHSFLSREGLVGPKGSRVCLMRKDLCVQGLLGG